MPIDIIDLLIYEAFNEWTEAEREELARLTREAIKEEEKKDEI